MILTKAIIKQTYNKDNYYQVYIPLLRKANDTEDSATLKATKICLPGISEDLKIGDVVYVGFEDTEYDKPVIFGKLFTLDDKDIKTVQTTKVLKVTDKAQLPGDTTIGETSLDILIGMIKSINHGAGNGIKIDSNRIDLDLSYINDNLNEIKTIFSTETIIGVITGAGTVLTKTLTLTDTIQAGDRVKVYFKGSDTYSTSNSCIVEFEAFNPTSTTLGGTGSTMVYGASHGIVGCYIRDSSGGTNKLNIHVYCLDTSGYESASQLYVYKVERIRKK